MSDPNPNVADEEPPGQASDEVVPNELIKGKAEPEKRKAFANNMEVVVTMIANAVGLGNVWRFPYLCYENGGGAFFIPYTLMLVFAAMPLLGMEIAWGQFTSLGPLQSWNVYPLLGGVGISAIMCIWLLTIFYAVLTAFALFYVGASLYSLKDINKPIWSGCDNDWNTDKCLTLKDFSDINSRPGFEMLPKSEFNTAPQEFWHNVVSFDDGSIRNFGYPNYLLVIALFLCYIIVLGVVWRGVSSVGKANYFFGMFPYFCLCFLLVGLFQEGAAEGILVYLIPDFSVLLTQKVWADAGQQIFFSLTISLGVMVTLGSCNGFHEQCLKNTFIVVVVNCVTSFWVGFPIFALLGHMANEMGVPVSQVMDSGAALAFIAYPQALTLLPGAAIWAVLFNLMLFSVALGTVASNAESCMIFVTDTFPILRTGKKEIIFRCLFILSCFLLALPMTCTQGGMMLLDIDNNYSTGINSFIIGICMTFVLSHLYGLKRFEEDIAMMIGHRPNWYWRVTWAYLAPIFLLIMSAIWIMHKSNEFNTEPDWSQRLGWAITGSTLVIIPLYALYIMCKQPSGLSYKSYKIVTKPNDSWGPARDEDCVGRYQKMDADEGDPQNVNKKTFHTDHTKFSPSFRKAID